MIKIRSYNYADPKSPSEVIHCSTKQPAILYDTDCCVMLKLSDLQTVKESYDIYRERYLQSGFIDEASALAYALLPADQEFIDKIFNSTLYQQKFLRELPQSAGVPIQ